MELVKEFYPESRFGGFTNLDGTLSFYTRVRSLLRPEFKILDLGCGRGAHSFDKVDIRRKSRNFRGECREIIGADVDPVGQTNPSIDRFILLKDGKIPLENSEVDLCFSDYVLEHIENPPLYFDEIARVLKPGGYICIRTTNSAGYVALMSRLTKRSSHEKILQKVQPSRQYEDVFPAFYRCNTQGKIKKEFARAGFDGVVFGYESEPSYMAFSRFFYFLGVLHQRLAPGALKLSIFAFGQKHKSS